MGGCVGVVAGFLFDAEPQRKALGMGSELWSAYGGLTGGVLWNGFFGGAHGLRMGSGPGVLRSRRKPEDASNAVSWIEESRIHAWGAGVGVVAGFF